MSPFTKLLDVHLHYHLCRSWNEILSFFTPVQTNQRRTHLLDGRRSRTDCSSSEKEKHYRHIRQPEKHFPAVLQVPFCSHLENFFPVEIVDDLLIILSPINPLHGELGNAAPPELYLFPPSTTRTGDWTLGYKNFSL